MIYLFVLGREPQISLAEIEALLGETRKIAPSLAEVDLPPLEGYLQGEELKISVNNLINRLGGTLKIAEKLTGKPLELLLKAPEGKITLGVSDYSERATRETANNEALKLKKILTRHGRSVRVVENKEAVLSSATSLYNGLSGKNSRKMELIKVGHGWYKVVGVQDIDAYARRDQARPARDAKVGMLPPKLAQILINLCGPLPDGSRVLDPFCGTGVVLQEALLMGYAVYGTDIEPRMVEYSKRNLEWFVGGDKAPETNWLIETGDATTYKWQPPISAVACEAYLGRPMSKIPSEMALKTEKQAVEAILRPFFSNLISQITSRTPVVVAVPAWLRENGTYSRLKLLDFLDDLGYNVNKRTREGLLYHREGQIVARDIIILRKK